MQQYSTKNNINNIAKSGLNRFSYTMTSSSCYDGDGQVAMADGTLLAVKKLKKNNFVKSLNIFGNMINDRVLCIVKSRVQTEDITMCIINNLAITPWHPIFHNGEWNFPINLVNEDQLSIDWIYNVVLESGHVIFVNDLALITLGHNLNDNLAAHPYYGTDKIINDLKEMDGWEKGEVILINPSVTRNNGFVTKLSNNPF